MNKIKPFLIEDGKIDIGPFLLAFDQFHEARKVAKTDLEKAGTIQYFEFTYELAWKTLKRILSHRGKDLNSPKPVIREAALEGLIDDPEVWFGFIQDRNETVRARRVRARGDSGGIRPVRREGGGNPWRATGHPVRPGERPRRPVARDGAADREGLRRRHGHAAADAGLARQSCHA